MRMRSAIAGVGAVLLAAGALVATGPAATATMVGAAPPVVVTGNGTSAVTVSWDGAAEGYDGSYGNVLHLCAAGSTSCLADQDELVWFAFLTDGQTSLTLRAGMKDSNGIDTLRPGSYVMQIVWWNGINGEYAVGDPQPLVLGVADTPLWHQGYGRQAADEACLDGWLPSWEQWMNDGKGGWVCTRDVPMYS
jgi:hypothetical protein